MWDSPISAREEAIMVAAKDNAKSDVRVEDRSTLSHPETEKLVKQTRNTEPPTDQPLAVNPATDPGDNLAHNQTLTENPANLPSAGTGLHCGHCGQQVSPEGVHFDGNGFVASAPHANTMVLADNWPEQVAAQDAKDAAEAAKETVEQRNARITREVKAANNNSK